MSAEDVFGIVGTTQAGNFHIERVVAEGGFGVVYRALHGGFRAPVAIKCLKIPDEMSKDQRDTFLEKFREEAELTFRLSAAIGEVCRPLHVDVLLLSDGRFVPFLAMEWLEGESLDSIVTRRRQQGLPPLGLHKVVKMMRPVAAAVAKAHRFPGPQGAIAIIHRDLKPENLMVATIGGTESMKILDFGIAKAKRAASQAAGRATGRSVAEDESASFTPAYGAPEQWAPKSWGETGPWTDVWGLGLCMVEALCGRPPIDGEPWVMRRVCLDEKRRPTPRNNGADIPLEVEKVFETALAVDPRKRYKTIEAFFSELEKAIGLPPTFGPRDDRREPDEAGAAPREETTQTEASKIQPPVSSVKQRGPDPTSAAAPPVGERLARIELQKMPASAVRSLPPKVAAPAPAPAPAPASTSGSWEFDLGGASSAVQSSVQSSEAQPSAPKSPRVAEPSPPPAQVREPSPLAPPVAPAAAAAGPAGAPPPRPRQPSLELEMPLPSRSEPPARPVPSSLEMSLPILDAAPQVAAPPAFSAPAAAEEESLEMGLEMAPLGAAPALDLDRSPPNAREGAAPQGSPERASPKAEPPMTSMSIDYERPMLDRSPSGSFRSPAAGPRPDADASRPPAYRPLQSPRASRAGQDVRERLRAPVGILLLALVVAGADTAFHRITGEGLMLGPIRPFWIAAPLALIGVGLTLWRLILEDPGDG